MHRTGAMACAVLWLVACDAPRASGSAPPPSEPCANGSPATAQCATPTSTTPTAPPTCADAARGVETYDRAYRIEGGEPEKLADVAAKWAGSVAARTCTDDQWPPAVIACYARWQTLRERDRCHDLLSPPQLERLKDAAGFTAAWKPKAAIHGRTISSLFAF
jgi:hypothetical protein